MSENQRTLVYLVSCAALLIGCGGSTPEPEAPDEAPPPEPVVDESSDTPDEMADDDGADDSESMTGEPASKEDFRAALQVVLQDEALQNAMNLTEPGRFPIKIAGPDIPSNLELEAATKAVEIVQEPEDPKTDPVLIFQKIEVSSTRGSFKYRYDVEGVRGTSTVKKNGDVWELKASRISKY